MADDGPPAGVDYASFTFDDKMRIYYSMRPPPLLPRRPGRAPCPRACRLPTGSRAPPAGKLFPYEPMHQWLSYGGSDKSGDAFSKREFSFTLANDIYIRCGLPARARAPQARARRRAAGRTESLRTYLLVVTALVCARACVREQIPELLVS